jgi:hypothetical protein
MALFEKIDPDTKQQRDAESALRSKRRDRESLTERLGIAEAAIVSYRAQARQLASEGADDAAISKAEGRMRDSADRCVTLRGAIDDVDKIITGIEREIEQIIDRRCRAETSAAVNAMGDRVQRAAAAFDEAAKELEAASKEGGLIVPESRAISIFTGDANAQLKPATEMVVAALRQHAQGVLSGHAPASLPRPAPEPVKLALVKPPPEMMNVFALKNLKYVNDAGGVTCIGGKKRSDVPESLGRLAISSGLALDISDPRCRDIGYNASPYEPDEANCEWLGKPGAEAPERFMRPGGTPEYHSTSPSPFTPMDRGPAFSVPISRGRGPEPLAATGTRNLPEGERP